jgi:hypothetical protein
MNQQTQPTIHAQPLSLQASQALRATLRAKRQHAAPLIIKAENDLFTFNTIDWLNFAISHASNDPIVPSRENGQYLGRTFADITAWNPAKATEHIIQLAGTIADNLNHPKELTAKTCNELQNLYDQIPQKFRDAAYAQAEIRQTYFDE